MADAVYHIPVMLGPCLEGLAIKPDGVYVDVTFGGGGHSRAILDRLGENGRLIAFDQDEDVKAHLPEDGRFTLVDENFRHLKRYLRLHQALPVDGILADLGVSSHQFDEAERGFSFRADARLDMRMDRRAERTAYDIINGYEEADLRRLLYSYGELSNAGFTTRCIVKARSEKPIETVAELKSAVEPAMGRDKQAKFLAKLFQAIRIELNEEMEALRALLTQSAEVLRPGGRLVVMSYHSLEDRLVKNFIKRGNFEGEVEKDFFGNDLRPFDPLYGKAIVPDAEEEAQNPRSRSAKLRIGIKRA